MWTSEWPGGVRFGFIGLDLPSATISMPTVPPRDASFVMGDSLSSQIPSSHESYPTKRNKLTLTPEWES